MNYVKIAVAFLIFYTFNIFHFWAVFELGISESETATWYQVIVFCFTVFVGIILLISGSIANAKKREFDFMSEIRDKKEQEAKDAAKIAAR
jgi:hypothetical protein